MDQTHNPFSLEGKNVLITGASSGIGRAVSILSANMGANVIITARSRDKLQETVQLSDNKIKGLSVADLTQKSEIDQLVEAVPSLDGVVHCAGIGHRKPCKFITEEDIESVMKANFSSVVLLQSALLSHKKINKQGSIVVLSSRTSEIPTIANSMYSASKGALLSYSRCLAAELAPRLIRVNCISPAMVWTDLITNEGISKEDLKEREKSYPLQRYGKPEDIANLAVFLLSDAASWITGSNFDITGGAIEL